MQTRDEKRRSNEHFATTDTLDYAAKSILLNSLKQTHYSSHAGRRICICAQYGKEKNDNQTSVFIPCYVFLKMFIGCSVDDNYLLECQIAK